MSEIIRAITEHSQKKGYSYMAGFKIITDKQEILMLIDDESSCCENWGYFLSEDDTEQFVGAELRDIKITDTELNKEKHVDIYEGGIMFVDIETNKGTLQFVAYNDHNGYYGHEALVESTQLNHKEVL